MTSSAYDLAIEEAFNVYVLDHRASRHSANTIIFYETQLRPFFAWLRAENVERLSQIRPNHIRAYIIKRTDDGLSEWSVNTFARAIRAFLRFCVKEEWLAKSPMTGVAMPKIPQTIPTSLTQAQVKKLINVITKERDKAIVLVLLDTGLRMSELINLRGSDIDVATGSVFVRKGKGNKQRMTAIGAKTIKAVIRYYGVRGVPKPEEHIWLAEYAKTPLTNSGLTELLKVYTQKLGFKTNAHLLRRTFATESLKAGMDVYTLARLLGHSTTEVLQHYLPLTDTDLTEAQVRFGLVDNL